MIEKLWVLYDPRCGFCVSSRRWLEGQPSWVPLEFVPAGSPEAATLFPGLRGTGEELTVVSADGDVYRSSAGWLMCLWALREYRSLSERLSSPALLPLARQAFEFVARNRMALSRTLGLMPEEDMRRTLWNVPATCASGVPAAVPLPAAVQERPGPRPRTILLSLFLAWLLVVFLGPRRESIALWALDRGIVSRSGALRAFGIRPQDALAHAASRGDSDRVRLLVQSGVDVNGRTDGGDTALMDAAAAGRVQTAQQLMALGADPSISNRKGRIAAAFALDARHPELLPALKTPPAILDRLGLVPDAAGRHDVKGIAALLAAGANVNSKNASGATALMIVAENGWEDALQALLAAHADPNVLDARGRTALMRIVAMRPGFLDRFARRLIDAGAQVDLHGGSEPTALMSAAGNGKRENVELLLDAGANVNARTATGRTPLHYAAATGNVEAIERLLAAAADPNAPDQDGLTPLMEASKHRTPETVRVLLSGGANAGLKDGRGMTAEQIAMSAGASRRVLDVFRNPGPTTGSRQTPNDPGR